MKEENNNQNIPESILKKMEQLAELRKLKEKIKAMKEAKSEERNTLF